MGTPTPKKFHKVAVYDPYLDTLGGGERYTLTAAESLQEVSEVVHLFWSGNTSILPKAASRFNLDLSRVRLVPDIFRSSSIPSGHASAKLSPLSKVKTFASRLSTLKNYDLIFYVSDGSLPFLTAKKNLIHFQVPFHPHFSLPQLLLNRLKSFNYQPLICNSVFTSDVIRSSYHLQTSILYPPVDIASYSQVSAKYPYILSVGRFDNILNAKKQDVLIDAFRLLTKQSPASNYRLILAGGTLDENNSYLIRLRQLAVGLPVEFVVNPDFPSLRDLYLRASVYWHGAGFGVDDISHPELVEHFGITPVEAMAARCLVFVPRKGGLKEIVIDGENGFFWDDPSALAAKTAVVLRDLSAYNQIISNGVSTASKFSKENFKANFLKLL
jgi:glycosyltransferase involved in cell wall biosynthesis